MAEKWSYPARDRYMEKKDDFALFLLKLCHCEAKNSVEIETMCEIDPKEQGI